MNARQALGQQGEQLAAEFLEECGLRILDRNWRCPEGEIDIVAIDQGVLAICEVKTRSDTRYGTPLEAVSTRKRNRLRRLALRWIAAYGVTFDEIRIDVVTVLRVGPGDFAISHVTGVG
jgi:putative endonuclease